LADDYSTTATVVSFTGLTDAQQHVALELGRPAAEGTICFRGVLNTPSSPSSGTAGGR
jgi:hypothetical protein